uniref:Cysteine desulfurase n=1 Tax=Pavo cristatus TaxID=9049 RepID=A0A8C9EKI3_PAVCR
MPRSPRGSRSPVPLRRSPTRRCPAALRGRARAERPPPPHLRHEKVPNSAPAAMPTAKPITKPIFTLSKQLGCDCPYGPTVTGICNAQLRAPHRPDLTATAASASASGAGGRGGAALCRRGPVRPSLPAAMQLWRCLAALRAVPLSPRRRLSAAAPRTQTEAGGAGTAGAAARGRGGAWRPPHPPRSLPRAARRWRRRSAAAVPGRAGNHPAGACPAPRPLAPPGRRWGRRALAAGRGGGAERCVCPQDPRVLDRMLPYLTGCYGNPHSRTHAYGWESEAATERARRQVADLIGADPREIIFTSGATESNNTAIKGVARFYKSRKKHIITTQTEHKCVLDSCRSLEAEGFQITYLPVQKNGLIDLKELEAAFRPDTSLVSVMAVNNEIGVKQPIRDIGEICRARKVFFHTDAAQAVGKIPMDVNDLKIDLMSISGHKIYGPKGVGAIYVRRRPRVRLEPLQSGGGQERGLRSGTVPTPLAVGLGAACEVAQEEMEYDHKRISQLAERLVTKIMSEVPDVVMNGDREHRYPGCINLSFAYVEGESLLMALKDVALSSGSACTSASLEPSYVLRAIGADEDLAHSSIRFGIGRFTTEEEIDYTVQKCIQHVKRLREMSPLWEMVQDGIDLKSIKWSQH